MKGLTPYIKYGLSLLSACLLFSCTEMNDEDLALDYDTLTPTAGGEYTVTDDGVFPDYIPQYVPVASSSMIMVEGETIRDIYYYGSTASDLQEMIDSNKASFPDDFLVIHISTAVEVTDTPVTLYSNTVLNFESSMSKIYASAATTANALIYLPGTDSNIIENVAIQCREEATHLMLDGNNNSSIQGIRIEKSVRVHMDNLIIANCGDGIGYTGINDSDLNYAGSVTRCEIYGCSSRGIVAYRNRGLVVANNYCHDNAHGIYLTITSATVHMNTCTDNSSNGIYIINGTESTASTGPFSNVTRNELSGNGVGIGLGSSSNYIFITENNITGNTTGVSLAGTANRIFDNTFDNTTELSGTGCLVMQNKDILSSEVPSGVNYFNPPTASNPHTDEVMITRTRKDLVITQDDAGSITMYDVQKELSTFQSANSSAYVVLTLNGTFVANGDDVTAGQAAGDNNSFDPSTGLTVPAYTSVVLNGLIYAEGEDMRRYASDDNYAKDTYTGGTQMVRFISTGYNSFSGGTLDCTGMPAYGVYAPVDQILILDDMEIIGAVDNNISAINHSGASTPMIVHDCVLNGLGSTNRGVWAHVCSHIYMIGCKSYNHYADFVDIDASGNDTYLLFNYTYGHQRDGVFIEEGASRNYILGNYFYGDGWGVGQYSTDPSGSLGYQTDNIFAFNRIEGSEGGFKLQHAQTNFSYNNMVIGAEFGIYSDCRAHYSCNDIFSDLVWQSATLATMPHIFFSTPN